MSKDTFDESLIIDAGTVELPEDIDLIATKKIEQAEDELKEFRLQIRWNAKQVNVIKRAASIMGVPYQTYIKQVLMTHALDDLDKSNRVLV